MQTSRGKIELAMHELNPPLVVGKALGVVIAGEIAPGKVMEIRPDNRYKDGNVQIVNGKIRGNSRTVRVVRAAPKPLTGADKENK